MSSMLREWSSFKDSNMIVEYKDNQLTGSKDCYLKGIMIQADTRNLNERVYPLHEIQSAVLRMKEKLAQGKSILCECDHPETLTINLDRVAGMITDVWMEGNNGYGVIKLFPNSMGSNLRIMLESGAKLGVSSRGTGNVDHNGIVSEFEIVTVDIVAEPSAPDAYPEVVFESLYKPAGHIIGESNSPKSSPLTSKKTNEQILQFFKDLKG